MAPSSTVVDLDSFTLDNAETTIVEAASLQETSKVYKYLLVFAGFMAMFQVIGVQTSYGVFQAFYSSNESFLPPDTSQAAIAFVGTLGN
jgi:hypothetical protein